MHFGTTLRRSVLVLAAASLVASATLAAPPHATIGTFGLDLAGGDPTVRPGDDFFRYGGGRWLQTEQLPADRSTWSTLGKLSELSQQRVREILDAAASGSAGVGSAGPGGEGGIH